MRRWLALALLFSGSALAEPALQLVSEPVYMRIAEHVPPQPNIIAQFGGSTAGEVTILGSGLAETMAVGGRAVLWGGGVVLTAALVKAAIDYGIKDPLQRWMDDPFKNWWQNKKPELDVLNLPQEILDYEGELIGSDVVCSYSYGGMPGQMYNLHFKTHSRYYFHSIGSGQYTTPYNNIFESGRCDTAVPKTLQDMASHIDLPNLIKNYIKNNPEAALKELQPTMEPMPNINQLEDNPFAQPFLDTDNDGFSDSYEFNNGSDLNDYKSTPKTDTVKNDLPDGTSGTKNDTDSGTSPTYNPNPDPDPVPVKDPAPDPNKDPAPDPNKDPAPDPNKDPVPDPNKDPDSKTCKSGQTLNKDTDACEDDPTTCKEGQILNKETGECEDKPKEDNVENTCGDFSIPRLLKYTGSYLKDLIVPCEDMGDLIQPIVETAKTKFPFSVAMSLQGWFKAGGGSGTSNLPDHLGPIPLRWSWLTGLWTTIKTLVGVALYAWFGYWLIDRFAPRTNI